jgi:peptidoglycan/xylan/chitin deacetylase (PgdA/CDA1 family)
MVRRRIKQGFCSALAATGLDALLGRLTRSERWPWVVGYHAVVETPAAARAMMPGLPISAATLEQHLDWIGARFDFVSLDEWATLIDRGRPHRRPAVAITFDDGYRGVHDFALPLLRRKGIPAAVFVVTGLVGTSRLLVHDRVYQALRRGARELPEVAYRETRAVLLDSSPDEAEQIASAFEQRQGEALAADLQALLPMSWEMLLSLRAAGLTIGSHTRSHQVLKGAAPERLALEVRGSQQDLETRLGAPVVQFAYPDGQFDKPAVDAVASAGYRLAFTTCRHRDVVFPELTLPRTMLWECSSVDDQGRFSPAILSCQAHGLLDRVAGCNREHSLG